MNKSTINYRDIQVGDLIYIQNDVKHHMESIFVQNIEFYTHDGPLFVFTSTKGKTYRLWEPPKSDIVYIVRHDSQNTNLKRTSEIRKLTIEAMKQRFNILKDDY